MLLTNYYNMRKFMFSGSNKNNITNPFSELPVVNTGGSNVSDPYPKYSGKCDLGHWLNKIRIRAIPTGTASSDTNTFGIYLGSGSTPADKTNYTLESPIVSGLNITSPQKLFEYTEDAEGNLVCSCSQVVTNMTDAEINIYEIGIVVPVGTDSSKYEHVLVERTVLSNPIIIPPGEPRLLTISVDLNMFLTVK